MEVVGSHPEGKRKKRKHLFRKKEKSKDDLFAFYAENLKFGNGSLLFEPLRVFREAQQKFPCFRQTLNGELPLCDKIRYTFPGNAGLRIQICEAPPVGLGTFRRALEVPRIDRNMLLDFGSSRLHINLLSPQSLFRAERKNPRTRFLAKTLDGTRTIVSKSPKVCKWRPYFLVLSPPGQVWSLVIHAQRKTDKGAKCATLMQIQASLVREKGKTMGVTITLGIARERSDQITMMLYSERELQAWQPKITLGNISLLKATDETLKWIQTLKTADECYSAILAVAKYAQSKLDDLDVLFPFFEQTNEKVTVRRPETSVLLDSRIRDVSDDEAECHDFRFLGASPRNSHSTTS